MNIPSAEPGWASARRVITLQAVVVLAGAVLTAMLHPEAIRAVLYGGMVALLGSLTLFWRLRATQQRAGLDAHRNLRMAQQTSAARFVLTVVLLALPLTQRAHWPYAWVVAGFVAGQITGLVGLALEQIRKNGT